jgi:hypothetical protein
MSGQRDYLRNDTFPTTRSGLPCSEMSRNAYWLGCSFASASLVFCPNETCVLQSDKIAQAMVTKRGMHIWKVRLAMPNYSFG